MTIRVEVGFVGVLRKLARKENVTIELKEPKAVKDIIQKLTDSFPLSFRQALIDPDLEDPRPNVIILVNKREIGVLEGLETKVGDGDKLVLIPVSHGG